MNIAPARSGVKETYMALPDIRRNMVCLSAKWCVSCAEVTCRCWRGALEYAPGVAGRAKGLDLSAAPVPQVLGHGGHAGMTRRGNHGVSKCSHG
ncbi:hypothetical protein NDU88_001854 [Pleurodeles waltl]|uniref:Uncharacterized protein n=1 Tax=Pleurodeles waltl TaxID=8319 RepID=A0AAV7KQK8_PLEWA|nr:hypothetical protein NDU88_001854 [Pleurodeles waltl]